MAIKLENVSFFYNKNTAMEKKGLTNVSLQIKNGEFVALLGKTGSGKSTLMNIIAGLDNPHIGTVSVDFKAAIMLQNPENQLFAQTVLEEVMYGPKNLGKEESDAKAAAEKALKQVGFEENIYFENPSVLSGGQKRKVILACVLAMNRSLVLLDEPTAGLDSKSAKEIMEILQDLNKTGTTVVIASHDYRLAAEWSSRLVILYNGAAVFDDKPENMLCSNIDYEDFGLDIPDIYKISLLLYKKGIIKKKNLFNAEEIFKELKKNFINN